MSKDRIKVLSTEDFRQFCDQCSRDESQGIEPFSADRQRLVAADPLASKRPSAGAGVD